MILASRKLFSDLKMTSAFRKLQAPTSSIQTSSNAQYSNRQRRHSERSRGISLQNPQSSRGILRFRSASLRMIMAKYVQLSLAIGFSPAIGGWSLVL
jgi:hypothetical protein